MHGAALLFDYFHVGVFLEFSHGRAQPLPVCHQSNAAVPRSCISSLCIQQRHGDLLLARGLMNGESEMMWEPSFNRPGKCL